MIYMKKSIIITDREYNGIIMIIDNAKAFGNTVKMYRKKQKATQLQVAAIANTGVRFISDLENGKPSVQLDKALKVARLLGIRLEADIIEGSST